jgi:Flp pilus assembly protein TadG
VLRKHFRAAAGQNGSRRGFLRGRRGSLLTWAALMIVPLLGFVGLATDTARAYLVRARLAQALDAAVLAAGRTTLDQAKAEEAGRMVFLANFPAGHLDAAIGGPTFTFNDSAQTVTVKATAQLPTYFVHLVGQKTFTVSASAEAMRQGTNLEIALVLDVTGSMSGQRIVDLKTAAKDLLDIVVYPDQTEYYSKVAIVPYSMGVNVGSYAAQVRGNVTASKAITGATRANPVVVTSSNHGFNNGDKVFIAGVKGMTQINNNVDNTTTATTSPQFWVVANRTTNSFALTRSNGSNADGRNWTAYSSAGAINCTVLGCPYYTFTNMSGGTSTQEISSCVSERTGSHAYTDAAPSTAYVGRAYASTNNPCPDSPIVPMTADKALLKTKVEALQISGSTAGQIGTAWGWYMLSPKFGYLWPNEGRPADYDAPETLKIAVIMTDGEYNTAYCNGVIAKNSESGSGASADKINCNATNGSAFSQAEKQCAGMKAAGIIVFTVGFDVGNSQQVKDLLKNCASGPSYAYLASDGAALKQAFRNIAISISRLRLSR